MRTLRTDTRLVFTSDNASMSALQITWKYQTGLTNSNETMYQNSNTVGGFELDWRLSKANTKPQIIAMDKEKAVPLYMSR